MTPPAGRSSALSTWCTESKLRLDQFVGMHAKATGAAPGRRWETTQFNRALMVALVGQFQAYCRDLHDCAVEVHVRAATEPQAQMLRVLLTEGRKLDTGNPRGGALGSDFGRLGFKFVDRVKAFSAESPQDLKDLEELVDYRNAVAHANETVVSSIEARHRVRATKLHFGRNRKSLDRLAHTMDTVVASELARLLGIDRPW